MEVSVCTPFSVFITLLDTKTNEELPCLSISYWYRRQSAEWHKEILFGDNEGRSAIPRTEIKHKDDMFTLKRTSRPMRSPRLFLSTGRGLSARLGRQPRFACLRVRAF